MKPLHKEPLVHFLLIGAMLFGLYALLNPSDDRAAGKKIVVSAGDIERMSANWAKKWKRTPTEIELQQVIEAYIRDEVYYREALALGLDRGDTVLRRRLLQKMEFLSNDIADVKTPDDAELQQYFTANRDKYILPERISFTHIYFSFDKRGEQVIEDAERILAVVRSNDALLRAPDKGDPFILQYDFDLEPAAEVSRIFGKEFAERILQLETGSWQGPVPSGYGLHLVRVEQKTLAQLPDLADVIDKVRTDWGFEHRQKLNRDIYQGLRKRYKIVVETPQDNSATAMSPPTGGGSS